LSSCTRPLDPLDAEALASGGEPVFALDALEHVSGCSGCRQAVSTAGGLLEELERLPMPLPAGLAERVLRLRPFSRRERLSLRLWTAPAALSGVVFAGGLFSATLPGLTGADRAGLTLSAAIPVASFFRSSWRWLIQLVSSAPSGFEALAEGMTGQTGLGLIALAMMLPVAFGFRRVLARAASRR
jgi:hypothetical protein